MESARKYKIVSVNLYFRIFIIRYDNITSTSVLKLVELANDEYFLVDLMILVKDIKLFCFKKFIQ